MMSHDETLTLEIADEAKLIVKKDALFGAYLAQHAIARTADRLNSALIEIRRGVPKIGEIWKSEGGLNGGPVVNADGTLTWQILAPREIGYVEGLAYGGYGVDEPSAASDIDGLANTNALCESSTEHPMAEFCRAVTCEGHRDFFQPAKRQAAALYANVPHLFDGEAFGLSTQYSANNAWIQFFDNGYQYIVLKVSLYRGWAVRSLIF
jgi:hypothetical protein